MSEEEKEAIERIQKRIKDNEDYSTNQVWLTEDVRCARVVLNLIQKQEKIIDKMAEIIEECRQNGCIESEEVDLGEIAGVQGIIEYFKKEVEKE